MKIDLEVLASTAIKRKKPWPRTIWIGEEQESLLLLDAPGKRVSVLYVPSGKTKRRLPKVSPLAEQTKCFSSTRNGRQLLGLLENGEIFIWHKDKDVLKFVAGLDKQDESFHTEMCHIDGSDDCHYILVTIGTSLLYLWVMEKGESVLRAGDSALKGSWHKITIPSGMELPLQPLPEQTVSSVFYHSVSLGHCCQCSLVFNRETMLCVATLVLKFPDPIESFGKNLPKFSAEWSLLEYPFHQIDPEFECISSPGSYVSHYSANGQVLAVAANQRSPSKTSMLFVSPLTDTVLAGNLKNCGTNDPAKSGRHYWVADVAWTSDSLFLACMLKNGSVCLIPRLGDPVAIETSACNVCMGPAYFLPLHPAIFFSDDQGSLEPSVMEIDPLQQKFSVATHPSLPLVLFSDGFLVTVAQLHPDITAVSLMKTLVDESARHLKRLYNQQNLDMTVANELKLTRGQRGSKHNVSDAAKRTKARRQYEFEMAEKTLNATHGSDVSITDDHFGMDQFGAIGNLDAGKIVFGEPDIITIDPNATFSGLDASDALLKYLEESMSALTLVWRLGASYADIWSSEVDGITKQAVHNLSKIFTVVLDCPAMDTIMPQLSPRHSHAIQNPRVYNIIVAYRNFLQLLRFDTFNQHLIPAALKLVHKTIKLMLTNPELAVMDPRLKTLVGCFSLLKHAETSLNRVYVWVPSDSQTGTPTSDGTPRRFEPAVMTKLEQQFSGSHVDIRGVHLDNKGQLPGKRLASTWKLLLHHSTAYHEQIYQEGDVSGELASVEKLLTAIQQVLHDSDTHVTPRNPPKKLSAGDRLSVDGDHTLALEAWREQLKELTGRDRDSKKTCRTLHAMLYTFLKADDLRKAVDFIDDLIFQASVDTAMNSQELPAYDDGSRPPMMTLVTHRSQDSEEEELVPCIKNKSIRLTVQSMARFMAAYFSNQSMYIYPPHCAQPLPPTHFTAQHSENRVIPKSHDELTQVITRERLSTMWTTERAVEYLLLSGLMCETAWFAHKMGDWKTAYLLSVAHTSHQQMAPQIYNKVKKPHELPGSLSPHAILQEKLLILIQSNQPDTTPATDKHTARYYLPINEETSMGTLTKTIQDVLTAGILSDVELAPWLLANLTSKLKCVVQNMAPLVPQAYFLPSPPLYCPQPANVEMGRETEDVEYEIQLRMEISSIIQLILVCLDSAHLSLPAARWYVQELFKMQDKAAQFKATTEGPCLELPATLQQYKIVRSDLAELKDSPTVCDLLASFRDFCTVLWFLHTRDTLSLALRKRGTQLATDTQAGQASPASTLGQEYVQDCFAMLKWAVNMLAFSEYVCEDGCIRKVILSLILELPATEDTADILAEHFYVADSLGPEVQEKLERLISRWQSVDIIPEDDGKSARPEDGGEEVRRSADLDMDDDDDGSVRKSVTFYQASPRAKTLSVYFHKQCEVVQKVLKKKRKSYGQYNEFVFNPANDNEETMSGINTIGQICIGSRPFETKQSYLEFLDQFYAISFTKVMDRESETGRRQMSPLLTPFAKLIREAEFEIFVSKYKEPVQQKRAGSLVMASPRSRFFRSQSESHVDDASTPQRKSFFRSNSSNTIEQPASPSTAGGMNRYQSEGSLFARGSRLPASPAKVKANMTGMASRFYKSEEVLYNDSVVNPEVHWILDVNFGQRYLALQQLLDYLHHWSRKQHALGLHGKHEKNLGLKPTMRIEVPTQLVVLSLWLLENKYMATGKKKARETASEPELRPSTTKHTEASPRAGHKLTTVDELTEHDSFTKVSNIVRSRSLSPAAQRSRSNSPNHDVARSQSAGFQLSRDRTLEFVRSINSTQEGTEQLNEYRRHLDRQLNSDSKKHDNDSSSLDVSSFDEFPAVKQSQSTVGSGPPVRRKRSTSTGSTRGRRGRQFSPQRPDTYTDVSNNSVFNDTMPFDGSPERGSTRPPQTSTPLAGNSPNRRQTQRQDGAVSADVSRITLPPTGDNIRGRPMGSMPAQPAALSAPGDIAQQLQQIVRGELRRMMEVQHQSMMAMMGALDGQQPTVAWQPTPPANQQAPLPSGSQQTQIDPELQQKRFAKVNMHGALNELNNLQNTEAQHRTRKSKSMSGKENIIDSPLRMSQLRNDENIEIYRIQQDNAPDGTFFPNFLRLPAEREDAGVHLPNIRRDAGQSYSNFASGKGVPEMPLLQVDRTVPAHKFPVSQRAQYLPCYQPDYFHEAADNARPPARNLGNQAAASLQRSGSPDSGIGIPLLRLTREGEEQRRQPRFGELLRPEQVMESANKAGQADRLREKYLKEYHQVQAERNTEDYQRAFGANLLHLMAETEEEERVSSPVRSPHKSPRSARSPSPRKERSQHSLSEHVSSKASLKSKTRQEEAEEEIILSEKLLKEQLSEHQVSARGRSQVSIKEEEGEESDATEAESVTDEEEPLHDGYAIKQGEFEAYLALENALAKTKDTHARIQLKTALRLQRQRMTEKWKRPKVDFATNTTEHVDMATEAASFPQPDKEPYVRYSEKATSITKDTGVDPIEEAVIEYNQSRQPHVLPPDIYMGLRFADTATQPGSDVTGQPQDSRGRAYLNVVDVDASAVLRDLREKPESAEPQLDASLTTSQLHLRGRMAGEEATRVSFEMPVIERPTRADDLTVKMFETRSMLGQDRMSVAIMPRDSMPESKYAIMQRLQDMNSQLTAIDQMSNNIERDFKSTRLAINTLEDMTTAMEAPSKHDLDQLQQQKILSRASSTDDSHTLSPQPSAKSPVPSARGTSRSTGKSTSRAPGKSPSTTARSKKSNMSRQDQKEMSVELAKLSGLSGISDIIGDMVALGEIDLDDVGLSRREADRLLQRGAIREEEIHGAKKSLNEIKLVAASSQNAGVRNKQELHSWMAHKRQKQMQQFKKNLHEMREKEQRPYRNIDTRNQTVKTDRKLKEKAEEREVHRVASSHAFMTQRIDDAQQLLNNILTDKPELPPPVSTSQKRKLPKDKPNVSARESRSKLRSNRDKDIMPSPYHRPQGILKTQDTGRSLADYNRNPTAYDSYDLEVDMWMLVPDPQDKLPEQVRVTAFHEIEEGPRAPAVRQIDVTPAAARGPTGAKRGAGVVPKLKLSLEDVDEEEPVKLQQTGNTTGDLNDYYKAVHDMDVSSSFDKTREMRHSQPEQIPEPTPEPSYAPQKTYKVKPYTEIVRIQRPEKTRKQAFKPTLENIDPQDSYLDSPTSARTSTRTSARTYQTTERERSMIYGSKRRPSKQPTESGPRRVKTYTERLQEMKGKEKFSTPVAPKSHLGSVAGSVRSMSSRPVSRISRSDKPKVKPVTYVQQLQKMNEAYHRPKAVGTTTTLKKSMIKSHKPPHKPKTYSQQLQELQEHKTFTGPAHSRRSHKSTAGRQRPYKDPYTPAAPDDMDELEAASVISGWSMKDDVRNILYGDDSSINVGPSASYAPSEQVSDYYDAVMGGDDYTASVDIDDLVHIADAGSVSSGSMMSFIDWDQVDDLIADIN